MQAMFMKHRPRLLPRTFISRYKVELTGDDSEATFLFWVSSVYLNFNLKHVVNSLDSFVEIQKKIV